MWTSLRASLVFGILISCWTAGTIAQEVVSLGGRKIVGGIPTTISKHPWQVALIISRTDGAYLCGGSVIARRWIVTAAHCFGTASKGVAVKVKTNATDYIREGVWLSDLDVIVLHANYNDKTHEHDAALIRLVEAPQADVIPLAAMNTPLAIGEQLVVTGWGATVESGATSSHLLKGEVPYVDNETCNMPDSYGGRIYPNMLCAGRQAGGVDSCQGDSGGPLVKGHSPEEAILVGIVSFGEGCARGMKYGVYTRVSAERDWIKGTISKRGE